MSGVSWGTVANQLSDLAFERMDAHVADALWQTDHHRAGWPQELQSERAWNNYRHAALVAETLDEGCLRVVRWRKTTVGFVSRFFVAERFLPAQVVAMECGTYLSPGHRGNGLNPAIKWLWLRHLFRHPQIQYALFAIAEDNTRAKAALTKLALPVHQSNMYGKGVFAAYAKRKSWEQGRPCDIFALEQSDYARWSAVIPHHSP